MDTPLQQTHHSQPHNKSKDLKLSCPRTTPNKSKDFQKLSCPRTTQNKSKDFQKLSCPRTTKLPKGHRPLSVNRIPKKVDTNRANNVCTPMQRTKCKRALSKLTPLANCQDRPSTHVTNIDDDYASRPWSHQ
jgi:hypothetical protein